MDTIYFNMAVAVILGIIKESVKNENAKAKLKKALFKVRDAINALYADEEEEKGGA